MSNESRVTREGQEGVRPGREATTGVHIGSPPAPAPAGASSPERRRRREGATDVDRFTSYYGLPVLNAPVWEGRDIAGYLFLGGLAGGSSLVGAAAHLTGRRALARVAKLAAAGGAALSLAALVHDLGRPERFLNMLRVFKPTSPMNVGSWLLSAYGPAAAAAALSEATGLFPAAGAAATVGAAALGPAVAAYTAALICDTAVPAWHDGYRQMPFVFVASGASAAAGICIALAPRDEIGPVQRLAVVAAPVEIALTKLMEQRMGMAAEAYHEGRAGAYMRIAEACSLLGAAGALFAKSRRAVAIVAGAALVAGSAFVRFGIFNAGIISAKDPAHTIVPQRARADGVVGA